MSIPAEYVAGPESAKVNSIDGVTGTIDTLRIIQRAIVESPQQLKAIAADAGYQPDYWSRVLTGARGITLDRLGRLDVRIQRAIVEAWAAALGLRLERREAARQRAAVLALMEAVRALSEDL